MLICVLELECFINRCEAASISTKTQIMKLLPGTPSIPTRQYIKAEYIQLHFAYIE